MDVQLVMFKENGDRKTFAISNPTTIVGRKEDCDIRIPLAEVSRQHAQFSLNGKKVLLKDLKSANGTFVNNKRVKEHPLAPGDRVVIGPVVFTVQIDGKPAVIKPVKIRRGPAGDAGALGDPGGESFSDLLSADVEDSPESATGNAPAASDIDIDLDDLDLNALDGDGSSISFDLDDLDLGDSKTDD